MEHLMLEYQQEELYAKAENLFGKTAQLAMLKEELAELIVAISHYERGRIPEIDVANELADVRIMIAQASRILDLELTTDAFIIQKLARLEKMVSEASS